MGQCFSGVRDWIARKLYNQMIYNLAIIDKNFITHELSFDIPKDSISVEYIQKKFQTSSYIYSEYMYIYIKSRMGFTHRAAATVDARVVCSTSFIQLPACLPLRETRASQVIDTWARSASSSQVERSPPHK